MHPFYLMVPFAIAEALLLWGVLGLRRVMFITSFITLAVGCIYAVVSVGSSAVFSLIGLGLMLFAATCILLGEKLRSEDAFVSRRGLRAIGALLFFLGFAGQFLL